MSPAAANPFPIRLVYFPKELKKLLAISFFGILNDFGIPFINPFAIPRTNPVQKDDPTVKATFYPKSFPENT